MYRVRFHGRGGQGIKTAAQFLGSAFFLAGLEVQDAPRYGAERRGAPMFAYVRAAHAPIKERGIISRPDLVVVADETLVSVAAAGVLQGLDAHSILLINSSETAQTWRNRLNHVGVVLTLPVSQSSAMHTDAAVIGASCAGAAARLVGVIGRQQLAQAIRLELGGHPADVVERNLVQAFAAFDAMAAHAGSVREGAAVSARAYQTPEWIEVPLDDVHVSAPDIRASATSELSRTGAWRSARPVIDYDRCNRCTWICSTLCPDSAIKVDADHTPRIDYDHCKACMVCVAVCPPHAIRIVAERAAQAVHL